jgi:hypothetical protein
MSLRFRKVYYGSHLFISSDFFDNDSKITIMYKDVSDKKYVITRAFDYTNVNIRRYPRINFNWNYIFIEIL